MPAAAPLHEPSALVATPKKPKPGPLRLACLTPEYPKPSHTFVRREIQELERRGHTVLRLSIRDTSAMAVDAADQEESSRTFSCLAQPWWKFLLALCAVSVSRPRKFVAALRASMEMWIPSERSLLRHTAYLAEAALLLRLLRDHQVRHVHVHFGTNAAAVARLIHCLGGPTYSMTIHGPGEFDAPRSFCLKHKVEDSLFTVAISSFGTSQIRRWISTGASGKLHVVRCSVGDDFLPPPMPLDPSSNVLVCVGRLTPQKGQLLLLDAARLLRDRGIQFRLVLAGDGELRGEIEARIHSLNLEDTVEITGWIDEQEVRRRLSESRALVLPSFAEGLPVAIMEAYACGRPVITTRIAGIPELVVHRENGWAVTAGEVQPLADAMEEALDASVRTLQGMARLGRDAVRSRHYTPTEVDRLEELLLGYLSDDDRPGTISSAATDPAGH